MSTRKALLVSVSTLALVVGAAAARADQNFTAGHTSNATAGGNTSTQDSKSNNNTNAGNVFEFATGVVSEVQNNGDNAALNNGNTVAAVIATGTATGNVDYDATSLQIASQTGGSTVLETTVNDDNVVADSAFRNAEGVFSKLQNNGAESAINNGNSVAAAVLEGQTGNAALTASSTQAAAVNGGAGNSYNAASSTNDNDIRNDAFQNVKGVVSAVQNNGPSSALNNGNTVAAVIAPTAITDGNATFNATSTQTATLSGANSAVENTNADTNQIRSQAFQNAQGVGSALQNNGAHSAGNNGNTVAAVISDGALDKPINLTTTSVLNASVGANATSNISIQTGSADTNSITDSAFGDAEGVFSALQNNGANSALNNGNTVSAAITNSADVDNAQKATAKSTQTATVTSTATGTNTNSEWASNDSNTISGAAFGSAQGVMSALQNNGANSAVNNGNTVSAVISGGSAGTANDDFGTDSTQTARVDANAGSANFSQELSSNDTNTLSGGSFQGAAGVASVVQSNGANSALNNGNTVAGFVIFSSGGGSAGGPNNLDAPKVNLAVSQTATVEANASDSAGDGNQNLEGGIAQRSLDTNAMTGNTFQNAEGIASALQNNGANSAINNGNTVSAVVADPDTGPGGITALFSTNSTQNALVTNADGAGNNGGQNRSVESRDDGGLGNPDSNAIGSFAFGATKGVFSAAQNNGANSAINNGNTVAAIVGDQLANTSTIDTLDATSTQTATVQSLFGSTPADGNLSEEANSSDNNAISGSAFSAAQGIGSVVQNNGANAALNNGNTVSAIVTDGPIGSRAALSADSRQDARVVALSSTTNRDQQGNVAGFGGSHPSNESNAITNEAFNGSEGVFSALQNNGPNSAVNNGNTVSAFVADGAISLDAASTLNANQAPAFTNRQNASVLAGGAGSSNDSRQQGSDDSNRIDSNAFMTAKGVISALQNNGGNSALNNGNTVAAVVAQAGISGGQLATFVADHTQQATVNAAAGTNSSQAGGFGTGGVDSDATNTLTGSVFSSAEGVFSVLQNNGANSAANNGNAVSAFIADGVVAVLDPTFTTDSTQTARVDATNPAGLNTSIEADDSDDTNRIDASAFSGTQGVASVMQNNGANSALNGGNTVSAIINGCASCTGAYTFVSTSTQSSTVVAGSASAASSAGSDNSNLMTGPAFSNVAGVFSVTQNNGANSAISNGNTVSAVIFSN